VVTRIERSEEVLVYSDPENPWVRVYFDRVKWPDGRLGRYNRVVEGQTNAGVAILPIAGRYIGLVRQYRYPVGEEVWEIPRGYCDTDDAKNDALRELEEETGLKAPTLRSLGMVHPNSGVLAATVSLFAAIFAHAHRSHPQSIGEVLEFKWLPTEWVLTEATEGRIKDAFTLSALFRAQRAGLLKT
jgi:ADP-ribose pyrophosphatase